jgi:hypothetical protein
MSGQSTDRLMRLDAGTGGMHARCPANLADRAWFRNRESGAALDEAET